MKAVQGEIPRAEEEDRVREAKGFFRAMGKRGGRPKGSKNQEKRVELTAEQKLDIVEGYEKNLPVARRQGGQRKAERGRRSGKPRVVGGAEEEEREGMRSRCRPFQDGFRKREATAME